MTAADAGADPRVPEETSSDELDARIGRVVDRVRAERRAVGLPENLDSYAVQRFMAVILASADPDWIDRGWPAIRGLLDKRAS